MSVVWIRHMISLPQKMKSPVSHEISVFQRLCLAIRRGSSTFSGMKIEVSLVFCYSGQVFLLLLLFFGSGNISEE